VSVCSSSTRQELEELLRSCHAVALCLRLNPDTEGLIGEAGEAASR
jgi:phosphoglycerate dehydrogenase-like enzyme